MFSQGTGIFRGTVYKVKAQGQWPAGDYNN